MATHTSQLHIFNIDDLTGSFDGGPPDIDFGPDYFRQPFVDKDGNVLYAIDSTFGFYVRDFVGAEDKEFDGDFGEGFAGNMTDGYPDPDPLPPGWVPVTAGLAVRNSKTDLFLSGPNNLGTWGVGLGSQATVKQSTEHYATMAAVLSDQAFPGDPNALGALDNDLRVLDYEVDELGNITENSLHLLWVEELAQALQAAIQNVRDNGAGAGDVVLNDIDFDRDGVNDTYRISTDTVQFEGAPVTIGTVDLGNNGSIDIADQVLNGYGSDADITDILEPNEASITSDIAFSSSYSVTVKDDGKLLYRWGEGVKRPNDIRMEVNLELPDEWTADADMNGMMDGLDNGGFVVTRAELVIRHNILNNPNDQVRPEDYENEAAIGRLPAHYIIQDPDNPGNELWVSPVNSFDGTGKPLPSYLVLDGDGNVVNTEVAPPNSTAVFDPDGVRVGYRNDAIDNGTIFKDGLLAAANAAAGLLVSSEDLEEGFTPAWYTTVNREPFEWSYGTNASPWINTFESFRSPEEAAAEGYTYDDLVSGPRWRLTPNKFGQDLPGLEVPLVPDTPPPYTNANIKYPTGEFIVTKLNLLDWEGDSPLATSLGWMTVNRGELDADSDGKIDEGWFDVWDGTETRQAGDDLQAGFILSATSPNGVNLQAEFLDTAVYVKGDRQDSANLFDIQLELEYESPAAIAVMGTVQLVEGITEAEQTATFEGGSTVENAVVFATPPSFNGGDVGSIAFTDITSTSATFFFKEANYLDGVHPALEEVSLVALSEGAWTLEDGSLLEVGTADFLGGALDTFQTVQFTQDFEEAPIVLVQLQTTNGGDWAIVRTQNITADGFEFALQEQEDNDGIHLAEVVGYAAIDASAASGLIDWSGLDAQAFSTGAIVTDQAGAFTFDASLGSDPLIAAHLASYVGPDPATLRLADVSFDGTAATAEFRAQEDRSLDLEVTHLAEEVMGLGFSGSGVLEATGTMIPATMSDGMEIA